MAQEASFLALKGALPSAAPGVIFTQAKFQPLPYFEKKLTHHYLVFNLQSQNHALCLLLPRYGVVLLLAAWLPVVFGLVHLCLQKTDNPLSLVQFLVGWLFFPLVQPALYIRLLLLHQVFVACCTMHYKRS